MQLGYALSSEEHPPAELIRYAQRAEQSGFPFAMISDHYHPWTNRQGNSAFVWTVLGAIAQATERLRIGTAVTCPTMRIHPAIIAQAAATTALMFGDRFFLGVGSGENLNEHILGDRWPPTSVRQEMLEEAIAVLRQLWKGGMQSHHGRNYTVENARVFNLPRQAPPIFVAAAGKKGAELAARMADGLIIVSPSKEVVDAFRQAGGSGKPIIGQVKVCWAPTEAKGLATVKEWWPLVATSGSLNSELPLPQHFEQSASWVKEEDLKPVITCGPDASRHLAEIKKYADLAVDMVYVHQVGPDQEGFFNFYQREILPTFAQDASSLAMRELTSRRP
jgi:G6PDH family F420-dependent oxidoreductase